jgi:hypothetical protein
MTLPQRRDGEVIRIRHEDAIFDVTFNRDPTTGRWSECFYANTNTVKFGSQVHAMLSDACIAISKLIEKGETFATISNAMGENRASGAASGPPSSVLGASARRGAQLDAESGIAPNLTGTALSVQPVDTDPRR